jgi:multimeric flavodoxin WrbA
VAASNSVLGLVGSPNREGRTFHLVTAALEGAASAGASVELVQIADHVVEPCRDCLPWECATTLECQYRDPGFNYLRNKLLECGALILGAPVYWWDTSGLVRYLMLKMLRVYARSAPLAGLPACGIAIAGGSGNGMVSGLRPLYHLFQALQMRALEPLPVTRFNWTAALRRASELGGQLASLAGARQPFLGLEERLLWYDSLPYLSMSWAEQRRLLAALVATALPADASTAVAFPLAEAEALAAKGDTLRSLQAVTRAYEAGVRLFEDNQG